MFSASAINRAEGEGGAGENPGTLPHKRYFEVPIQEGAR